MGFVPGVGAVRLPSQSHHFLTPCALALGSLCDVRGRRSRPCISYLGLLQVACLGDLLDYSC